MSLSFISLSIVIISIIIVVVAIDSAVLRCADQGV